MHSQHVVITVITINDDLNGLVWAVHVLGLRITFTFTFMHLADAFIQSDLHCILSYSFTFYQLLLSLGIEPMILALLAPCFTI